MSLTRISCKTLEHILVININKYLALDSILADCQHGFRSQRSCETQLVQFAHDIISNLDEAVNLGHKQTDLIIMEFAKAFDKVPHRRLLHKLDYYGIRGSTHKWIKLSKGTKIRNRYNQVPHLTQDTNGKVTNSQLDTTNESQEVSPFPVGDHKAYILNETSKPPLIGLELAIDPPLSQGEFCTL